PSTKSERCGGRLTARGATRLRRPPGRPPARGGRRTRYSAKAMNGARGTLSTASSRVCNGGGRAAIPRRRKFSPGPGRRGRTAGPPGEAAPPPVLEAGGGVVPGVGGFRHGDAEEGAERAPPFLRAEHQQPAGRHRLPDPPLVCGQHRQGVLPVGEPAAERAAPDQVLGELRDPPHLAGGTARLARLVEPAPVEGAVRAVVPGSGVA